jgi:hypothetical protein
MNFQTKIILLGVKSSIKKNINMIFEFHYKLR